jgi:hypothetical protein
MASSVFVTRIVAVPSKTTNGSPGSGEDDVTALANSKDVCWERKDWAVAGAALVSDITPTVVAVTIPARRPRWHEDHEESVDGSFDELMEEPIEEPIEESIVIIVPS